MSFDVDVTKRLGDARVGAAFEAGEGLTVLFGPSGAGKTSTLNMIAGLVRPDWGRVRVDGETLFALALQRAADGVGRFGEGFGWAVAGGVVGGGGAEEVEVVGDAAAAHGDVAALAEQFVGAE